MKQNIQLKKKLNIGIGCPSFLRLGLRKVKLYMFMDILRNLMSPSLPKTEKLLFEILLQEWRMMSIFAICTL